MFLRRIAVCVLAACAMTAVSAEASLGLGFRGSFGLGLGTTFSSDITEEFRVDSTDVFRSFLYGGSVCARISFDGPFIQPEIGFTRNQIGYRWSNSDRADYRFSSGVSRTEYRYESSGQIGYSSIDVPIIAGYELYLTDNLVAFPLAGVNLSFPFDVMSWIADDVSCSAVTYNADGTETGKISTTTVNGDDGTPVNIKFGFTPGILVGAGLGYRIGPSLISGDFRYLLDLTSIVGEIKFRNESKSFHILHRRGLSVNLGYMYSF